MASPGEFVPSLSEDTLKKARNELKEDPDKRDQVLLDFKKAIEDSEASGDPRLHGVQFERKDNAFLIRFLRARKFNKERSLELYINYYHNRAEFPKIFQDFTPRSVETILKSGVINVLDNRARDGAKVICTRPRRWDIDNQPVWFVIRSLLIVLEKLLEDEETQVHGVRLFINFQDVEFTRVWRFSQMEAVQKGVMLKLLQDGFPVRLKGLHLIMQPWYISIVLAIVKPFMKEKLKKRINIHGYNFSTLHEFISPENLPMDFEGTLPSLDNFIAAKLFVSQFGEVGVVNETDPECVVDQTGLEDVVNQMGLDGVIDEKKLESVIDQMGLEGVVDHKEIEDMMVDQMGLEGIVKDKTIRDDGGTEV